MNHRTTGVAHLIGTLLQKVEEARDPIARFIQLGNLFEVTLRTLATLTLGSFFQIRESRPVEIPGRLLAGLARPSLGHWCQLLHALPRRMAETGEMPVPEIVSFLEAREQPEELVRGFREIQFFLGKKHEGVPRRFSLAGFSDLLVAFRNKTKAHGAIQNRLAQKMNPILETSIRAFIAGLSWLDRYGLGVIPGLPGSFTSAISVGDSACPAAGMPVVLDSSGRALVSLYPAALWFDREFWFLNGWESPANVEFLSYATGLIHRTACEQIRLFLEPGPGWGAVPGVFGLRVDILRRDVWELAVDAAIMAQDRNRVFGPVQEIQAISPPQPAIRRAIEEIEQDEADDRPGDVILSHRPWCAARYLLEAIVYDLDQPIITNVSVIELALENALVLAADFAPETIALSPLGTEYGIMSAQEFSALLAKLWKKHGRALEGVEHLIITPREESQIAPLREALAGHFPGLGRPKPPHP